MAFVVAAASLPTALSSAGQWEVGKSLIGSGNETVCLNDPAVLMHWDQRAKRCTTAVLSSSLDRAEVHYTCQGGSFGNSKVEVLTPRSVRIETQGISDGYPFAYTLHARHVGPCASR
ncbi:MAG: hypothetical protein ABIN83_04450 [Sphingomicrobium sp.]